jgi:transposase-like protein
VANMTQYTDDDRARAVVMYQANGGNAKRTAHLLGVSRSTLRGWVGKDSAGSTNGTARIPPTELVQDRSRELGDRLEDVAALAIGEGMEEAILRSSGKDRAVIAGIAIEKAQLLKGKPTSRDVSLSVTLVASGTLNELGDRTLTVLSRGKV